MSWKIVCVCISPSLFGKNLHFNDCQGCMRHIEWLRHALKHIVVHMRMVFCRDWLTPLTELFSLCVYAWMICDFVDKARDNWHRSQYDQLFISSVPHTVRYYNNILLLSPSFLILLLTFHRYWGRKLINTISLHGQIHCKRSQRQFNHLENLQIILCSTNLLNFKCLVTHNLRYFVYRPRVYY